MPQNRSGILAVVLASVTVVTLSSCSDPKAVDNDRVSSESQIFTPEHPTVADAVKEFVGWRATPVQPIAFPHNKHIANGVACMTCHIGVDKGAVAGIPSVKLCMTCHEFFATDRPEVKKLTAYYNSGVDISWQRVYGFAQSAHVKFNHSPHIRAGIDCSSCHGDLANMTVAVRAVEINMGFCIKCHRAKQASTDCVTCHF
jgi:hypothetical protein